MAAWLSSSAAPSDLDVSFGFFCLPLLSASPCFLEHTQAYNLRVYAGEKAVTGSWFSELTRPQVRSYLFVLCLIPQRPAFHNQQLGYSAKGKGDIAPFDVLKARWGL